MKYEQVVSSFVNVVLKRVIKMRMETLICIRVMISDAVNLTERHYTCCAYNEAKTYTHMRMRAPPTPSMHTNHNHMLPAAYALN